MGNSKWWGNAVEKRDELSALGEITVLDIKPQTWEGCSCNKALSFVDKLIEHNVQQLFIISSFALCATDLIGTSKFTFINHLNCRIYIPNVKIDNCHLFNV